MKGLELPINTLIIVVLALIILLAVLALFYGVWGPGSSGITLDAAKSSACQMLLSTGCHDTRTIYLQDFDADKDGEINEKSNIVEIDEIMACGGGGMDTGDNLFMLCRCWYNLAPPIYGDEDQIETECKERICNCVE